MMEVKNIGVIGAGQMGAGIAQVCAAISKKV
ncbi:MAG TPA: 3-hydroxybutyryl-CoA dehydrogenase, partial [Candidatus Marinimicrobia bacterium]|nr:3-hydroxybutyryl-CoA dehydrogenase [Candidatus Neomarinimicrobiota bacterium]